MDSYWSLTEGVFNCLIDNERSLAFKSAIFNTVKEGDVVVDMGSGSGILAMFAAQAGASRVYAVEYDKKSLLTLKKIIIENNLDQKIIVLEGDVTKISLPEKIDVVVGEMIATGLVEELQVQAMNNILKFKKPNCKVVLSKYDSFVDVVYNETNYYGLKFPIVRYEYPDLEKLKSDPFSEKYLYHEIDFNKSNEEGLVDVHIDVVMKKTGIINGLRISSQSIFYDKSTMWGSFAYSYPIILPIAERGVKVGENIKVALSYKICGGFNTLTYSLK